jgi:CRISPR/Cas system CSM-associated protein Csm5 (group 7 of RAMP superfamily)
MQKCENCRHATFRRKLSLNQELRMDLANALSEKHENSRKQKIKMMEEIAAEFCKKGKINKYSKCTDYERKRWKVWVVDDGPCQSKIIKI